MHYLRATFGFFGGAFVLFVLAALAGCNEPASTSSSLSGKGALLSKIVNFTPKDYSAAANPNNPFDFVGKLHNECLEYISQYGNQRNWLDSSKIDSVIYLVHGYVDESICFYFTEDSVLHISEVLPVANYLEGRPPTMPDNLNSFLDDSCYAAELIPWFDSLCELFDDTTNISSFKMLVENLEDEFLQDTSGMNRTNIFLFLSATSISRYSMAYWTDTARVYWPYESSDGSTPLVKEMGGKKTAYQIVKADAVGAAVGGCVGFVKGAITGALVTIWTGGGALVGAATGACIEATAGIVSGGAIGSTQEAIRQFNHNR